MPSVFISSTSEDLKSYRVAARDAALKAGFEPKMMEYFSASGGPPLAECLKIVRPCDLVIVIVAQRYGWIPPDQSDSAAKSITWLECEQALSKKKDLLVFLVPDDAPWPTELKESHRIAAAIDSGNATPELMVEVSRDVASLKSFRQWVQQGRTRRTFITADDLRAEIIAALYEWRLQHPEFGALSTPPPDLARRYLKWLRDHTATMDIRGIAVGAAKAHNFPIKDLYIPLRTTGEQRSVNLEEALTHRRLVIVGDPGSGKTTFLRRIIFELAEAALATDDPAPLPVARDAPTLAERLMALFRSPEPQPSATSRPFPIFIRIAELAEHIRNCRRRTFYPGPIDEASPAWLADYLVRRSQDMGWGLDMAFFTARLEEGSAVVLLDGLDEASDRVERERMARLFENATSAYGDCRFAVTTRPQSYQGQAVLEGFEEARIEPLDPASIEAFLSHWCAALYPSSPQMAQNHQVELSTALREKIEIRRMARSPVMLTALAVLHWNDRRLPEQRAELYEAILSWLARSREKRPGREPAERSLELLQKLALVMQDHQDGRKVRVSAGWAAEHLTLEKERALNFLEEETSDSGIIVTRGGEVQFWHLTFQEYMAARAIAGMPELLQYELLLANDKIYQPEWRETVLLLAGILHVKQGRDKVDGLVSAILKNADEKPKLVSLVRNAGLVGAIVRDLQPLGYAPADPAYRQALSVIPVIFDRERAQVIDFNERLEAAEAMGQAGDPRLSRNNWVLIEAGGAPFHIGRYPVTVAEYRHFIDDDGYQNESWWAAGGFGTRTEPEEWEEQQRHPNRPVVYVDWYEASAYCSWAKGRLPSDAEWVRAAYGSRGREYPWGNQPPDATRANYAEIWPKQVTPVGLFPRGATPEGVDDMAGNVWEWVEDRFGNEQEERALRGGCYVNDAGYLRSAIRNGGPADGRSILFGFRCARE